MGFCFALSERLCELSPGFATVCDAPPTVFVSHLRSRATHSIHTPGPPAPISGQTLDRLSVYHGVGYRGVGFAQSVATPRVAFGKRTQLQTKMLRVMSSSRRQLTVFGRTSPNVALNNWTIASEETQPAKSTLRSRTPQGGWHNQCLSTHQASPEAATEPQASPPAADQGSVPAPRAK